MIPGVFQLGFDTVDLHRHTFPARGKPEATTAANHGFPTCASRAQSVGFGR